MADPFEETEDAVAQPVWSFGSEGYPRYVFNQILIIPGQVARGPGCLPAADFSQIRRCQESTLNS